MAEKKHMEKLNIITLSVGALETCAYIIFREGCTECAVIDPGGDANKISKKINELNLDLKYIVVTHSHFDHVQALEDLKEIYNDAKIVCHETCDKRMQSPQLNLGFMVGVTVKTPPADLLLKDNDIVSFDGVNLKSIFLPGHAPGHMIFYSEQDNVVFSGDTLFNGSLGRTDFDGCSFNDLFSGIKDKLLTMPDETTVYPGHGPETTIGMEKAQNPFIKDML